MSGVNNAKTTRGRPFKKGNPGRPKGAKDKISRGIKEGFDYVYTKLGGDDAFFDWVSKNPRNKELFYQWRSKMLPTNIGFEDGELKVKIIREIITKRPKEFDEKL